MDGRPMVKPPRERLEDGGVSGLFVDDSAVEFLAAVERFDRVVFDGKATAWVGVHVPAHSLVEVLGMVRSISAEYCSRWGIDRLHFKDVVRWGGPLKRLGPASDYLSDRLALVRAFADIFDSHDLKASTSLVSQQWLDSEAGAWLRGTLPSGPLNATQAKPAALLDCLRKSRLEILAGRVGEPAVVMIDRFTSSGAGAGGTGWQVDAWSDAFLDGQLHFCNPSPEMELADFGAYSFGLISRNVAAGSVTDIDMKFLPEFARLSARFGPDGETIDVRCEEAGNDKRHRIIFGA